jgi:Coenzyme PQQ synthesis protein D (PqqD)
MLPESRYTPSPDITLREFEGEAVLLNVQTGAYFSLNKVGTHIWQLYGEGKTLAEVVEGVCERFEVTPERAEADVRTFTERLVERGLLTSA